MHYNHGIDSHAITPDGTTIFMPAGEFSSDGKWYAINTSDGSEKGVIVTPGYGPHNTVVSLDGAHVYLGDRNHNNVGPDSLYVASTASYQVVKRAGRFMSGIRPFTVNGTETFAFVAITGLLGFQVCDLSTGLVPYKIDLTTMGFSNCGSCDSPTHGISLSPDERELYVCDQPNSYVHVFDVSGIFQNSAPTKVADIKLVNLLTGNDSGCTYECLREGWLHHSRDGRFVYVGESGDVISTATRSVVARLPALRNSRKMLEIDWQNGRPIATTTRYGLGYVVNRSIPLPPPPVLSTPSNGAAGQQTTVNLTWNASAAASSYRLQLSTDSAFSTLVVDDSTLTAMSRQVTSLSGTTTYYWHVNAKNNAGTSAFSSTWSFTTSIPPPAAPALLSPVNNATGQATTVTFLWNSSSGATKYRYQLATDSGFVNKAVDDSTLTDTTRAVTNLANSTAYYWRVSASNGVGSGAYSAVWKFATIIAVPLTPTLVSPANGSTGQPLTVVLAWNPAGGAVTYRVQLAADSLFGSIVLDDSTVTATSRQIGPLSVNTLYYWRVNAKNSAGTSAYSSAWNFTTLIPPPPAPALLSPGNNATGQATTLTCRWNSSSGAAKYRYQLATDSGFVNKAVDDSTLTDTTRAVANLANSTTYFWRVRASNGAGSGAYSSAWKFTTIVALPSSPALAAPVNGAACQSTALTLTWTAAPRAVQYRVQVALDSSFATKILDDSTVTTLSRQLTSLTGGTKYFWRVASSNAAGSSPYSAVWAFGTFPTSLLRDAFNRANGGLAGSNKWALIQNQPASGSLVIAANAVQPYSSAGNLYFGGVVWDSLISGGAEASLTIVQKSGNLSYTSLFLYARMNNKDYNTGTGYRLRFQQQSPTDRLEIHKVGPGYANYATLASVGIKINAGDVLTLRSACDNRTLIGLVNGVQVISATDMTYTHSQWYFALRGCVFPTPVRYDNFMISPRLSATSSAGQGGGREDTSESVSAAPEEFGLGQNYPNPFNPASTISFAVPKLTHVRIQVFNVLGQLIVTLVNEEKAPGRYSVTWEAGGSPSGVYLCRMLAGDYLQTRKMILAK